MGIKVIKAIKIKEQKDVNLYKNYEDIADLILFDSTSMEKSQRIPKDLLYKLPKGKKFGLAGAINSENILEYSQLGFNFLDLSSGLERENLKGYKDHLKIKNFINKINDLKN
jgi:phosphoribosylanthranilate isomerase